MKKLLAVVALMGVFTLGLNNVSFAEDNFQNSENTELLAFNQDPAPEGSAPGAKTPDETSGEESKGTIDALHHQILDKFIDGDPGFMATVLICLILGLALCIERVIYLNMATTNTDKLLNNINSALDKGGVEAAKEVARNTSGPVASIAYQGLLRADGGIDQVEKSIEQYGGVQMGLLEKGLSWIQLFIAIAPMLGFMGTVIGMIGAFDAIAAENNISPAIVADGIGVALITTVSGLIVAIILQIFYNYILSKIDGIVLDMESFSIEMVDSLYVHKNQTKA